MPKRRGPNYNGNSGYNSDEFDPIEYLKQYVNDILIKVPESAGNENSDRHQKHILFSEIESVIRQAQDLKGKVTKSEDKARIQGFIDSLEKKQDAIFPKNANANSDDKYANSDQLAEDIERVKLTRHAVTGAQGGKHPREHYNDLLVQINNIFKYAEGLEDYGVHDLLTELTKIRQEVTNERDKLSGGRRKTQTRRRSQRSKKSKSRRNRRR